MTILTTAELAQRLSLHVNSVSRMAREGRLPRPYRLGHKVVRWDWEEVLEHAKQKQTEGGPDGEDRPRPTPKRPRRDRRPRTAVG